LHLLCIAAFRCTAVVSAPAAGLWQGLICDFPVYYFDNHMFFIFMTTRQMRHNGTGNLLRSDIALQQIALIFG
jgi:hypothetical protein